MSISSCVLLRQNDSAGNYFGYPYPWCGSRQSVDPADTAQRRINFATRGFDAPECGSGPFYVEHINLGRSHYYVKDMPPMRFQDVQQLTETRTYSKFSKVCYDSLLDRDVLVTSSVWWNDSSGFENCDLEFVYGEVSQSWARPTGLKFRSRRYPPSQFRVSPEAVANWHFDNFDIIRRNYAGSYNNTYQYVVWADVEEGGEINRDYSDLKEYNYWLSAAHHLPGGYTGLHPGLFSAAYYAAQDRLPQLLSNTMQNLIEAAKTVISFANGIDLSDLRHVKSLAGNAWLAYRYQYNTTVSDLEELESAIERFDNLSRAKGKITSYGAASDDTGTYHCALQVDPVSILDRGLMKNLNLRPTLANAWDMIPYSFIVDWFTNIGSVLHAIDAWLDSPSFGSVNCWYSFTNNYSDVDENSISVYFRYSAGRPLLPYWSMDYSHKTTVWAYRATDVVSLLL